MTGNKKGQTQSLKEQEKPFNYSDGDGKSSVDYFSEFESIHNQMNSIAKTIRHLKKNLDSLSKQVSRS